MDDPTVAYAQARYDEIQGRLMGVLTSLDYTPDSLKFVSVSGFAGDNLGDKSANMPWYSGLPLLEMLDTLEIRPPDLWSMARCASSWTPGSSFRPTRQCQSAA